MTQVQCEHSCHHCMAYHSPTWQNPSSTTITTGKSQIACLELLIGLFKGYHMTLVEKWRPMLCNKVFGTMIIGIDQNWWMDQTDHISAPTYDRITWSCTPCSWFEHCTLSRSIDIDMPYCCCLLCHLAWSYTNDHLHPKYDIKLPTFILGTNVKTASILSSIWH